MAEISVKLIDSTFAQSNALGLSGERDGEHPSLMRWDRTEGDSRTKVWTDIRLREIESCWRSVALLVESPAYSRVTYKVVKGLEDKFTIILTHNRELLERGDPYLFYPLGGSRIKEWGLFEKDKMTSVIVGIKADHEGQRLRHEVARRFELERWGRPYTDYQDSKVPMLRPYRYSVVIENAREDFYFSEKLIDAISQGCIPIYWGCPSIGEFFDPRGIITLESLEDLGGILETLSIEDYESRRESLRRNLDIARGYACAEDWIVRRYPWLFT